jgi:hypothetical protein
MKDDVSLFLEQHPPSAIDVIFEFKDRFHESHWLTKVAYLCDIFCFLNELSLNLQGANINIFKSSGKSWSNNQKTSPADTTSWKGKF